MKSASARTSVSIEVYDTHKGDMHLAAIFFGKTTKEAKDRAQEYATFKAQESNARLAKVLLTILACGYVALAIWSSQVPGMPLRIGVLLGIIAPTMGILWWKERSK